MRHTAFRNVHLLLHLCCIGIYFGADSGSTQTGQDGQAIFRFLFAKIDEEDLCGSCNGLGIEFQLVQDIVNSVRSEADTHAAYSGHTEDAGPPAKAKTIEKFLGKDYKVKSSFGHIRDLAKKGLGINLEEGFEPIYEIPDDKRKVVEELSSLARQAKTVWSSVSMSRRPTR